ncbi:hypothetical protein [Curtobacterium ammoniigenes]|uniref:hypothetical protein n=1 Tax=Curtobacterium ammoniigenes TaxID=395387 RepID=UPI000AC80FE7|nr:hypothetical protein [Curtobacterium ammoniigenes]
MQEGADSVEDVHDATSGAESDSAAQESTIADSVASVEALPLDQHVAGFAALHDALRDRLENGDAAGA